MCGESGYPNDTLFYVTTLNYITYVKIRRVAEPIFLSILHIESFLAVPIIKSNAKKVFKFPSLFLTVRAIKYFFLKIKHREE